jgi:hypothetical protein
VDTWCPQCFAPAPLPTFRGPSSTRRSDDPVPVVPVELRYSRWQRTSVSFGPAGRIAASLALMGTGPLFWWFFQLGGAMFFVMWTAIVLPWGLRDVWRKVRVRR